MPFLIIVVTPSMVVGYFDVPRTVGSPPKANSPLVVDSNAVLPTPITTKLLQALTYDDSERRARALRPL